MTDNKLATVEAQPIARTSEPDTFLSFLERASKDPSFDVAKFEALMAAKERSDAQERKRLFFDALSALQSELEPIAKSGTNPHTRSKYVRLDDLLVVLRPMLEKHGFALSFDSKPCPPSSIDFTAEMMHRAGHSEVKHLVLPTDGVGSQGGRSGMNAIQAVGSTTSYARRYLIDMHLNLARRDEDDDGGGGPRIISPELAAKLRQDLETVGGDPAKFLALMKVGAFEEIREQDFARACQFIEAKRRQGAK